MSEYDLIIWEFVILIILILFHTLICIICKFNKKGLNG